MSEVSHITAIITASDFVSLLVPFLHRPTCPQNIPIGNCQMVLSPSVWTPLKPGKFALILIEIFNEIQILNSTRDHKSSNWENDSTKPLHNAPCMHIFYIGHGRKPPSLHIPWPSGLVGHIWSIIETDSSCVDAQLHRKECTWTISDE